MVGEEHVYEWEWREGHVMCNKRDEHLPLCIDPGHLASLYLLSPELYTSILSSLFIYLPFIESAG
jgi:hypothetical protein